MNGPLLAAFYSLPPNCRGYCGGGSFVSVLRAHLAGRAGVRALEDELKKFRAHYAYLSLIARENGMKPFDAEVVNAFWIGNPLLEGVSRKAMRRFILRDLFSGKQAARAKKLAGNLPEGAVPHHSFNSLYVNFVGAKVAKTTKNYDSCCVSPASVLAVSGKTAEVTRDSITSCGGRFVILPKTEAVALERAGMRPVRKPETGDRVSVHWGMAIRKITEKESRALKKYTQMNIEAVNEKSDGYGR